MSPVFVGSTGFVLLLVLLLLRIPVAFAMFTVGFAGIWLLNGLQAATGLLSSETFALASNSELIVVPLFILMGEVSGYSQIHGTWRQSDRWRHSLIWPPTGRPTNC